MHMQTFTDNVFAGPLPLHLGRTIVYLAEEQSYRCRIRWECNSLQHCLPN